MGSRFDSRPSRVAAPLLATTFVILGGAIACTGVVLVFSREPAVPLMIVGGIAIGLGLMAVLFRERPTGGSRSVMSWVFSRNARSGPRRLPTGHPQAAMAAVRHKRAPVPRRDPGAEGHGSQLGPVQHPSRSSFAASAAGRHVARRGGSPSPGRRSRGFVSSRVHLFWRVTTLASDDGVDDTRPARHPLQTCRAVSGTPAPGSEANCAQAAATRRRSPRHSRPESWRRLPPWAKYATLPSWNGVREISRISEEFRETPVHILKFSDTVNHQ